MTATYTPGSGADLDKVRLLLPDKDLTGLTPSGGVYYLETFTYSDEEIADLLTLESDDPYRAAALGIESFVALNAQSAQKVSGLGYSIDNTLGFAPLQQRAAWLRSQATSGGGALSFVSVSYGAANTDEFGRPALYPFDEC